MSKLILIVEDNEMNRDMLSRRLTKKGYKVEVAVNGKEFIDRIEDISPDIVLLDIRMPVMDGLTAVGILRNEMNIKDLPVIGLSAHAMEEDKNQAIEAGCSDYESKPIDLKILIEKIEKFTS